MLEINGNPNRRDLSERHARLAAEAGVRSSSTPTPTASKRWPTSVYAVATARRAWLTAEQIANTRAGATSAGCASAPERAASGPANRPGTRSGRSP